MKQLKNEKKPFHSQVYIKTTLLRKREGHVRRIAKEETEPGQDGKRLTLPARQVALMVLGEEVEWVDLELSVVTVTSQGGAPQDPHQMSSTCEGELSPLPTCIGPQAVPEVQMILKNSRGHGVRRWCRTKGNSKINPSPCTTSTRCVVSSYKKCLRVS